MDATDIFLLVLVAVRFVIAIQLTRLGFKKDMRNLLWLAGVFYINGLFSIFSVRAIANVGLTNVGMFIAQFPLVLFIHQTFYRDRQSPWLIFMGLALVLGVAGIWVDFFTPLPYTLIAIVTICNWSWHAVIAYQAFTHVAGDKYVEDWVKARYQLMIAYCVLMVLVMLIAVVHGAANPITGIPIVGLLVILSLITSLILQYLVWGMPVGFRNYLNRKYKAPTASVQDYMNLSDEDLRRQLQGK